jgi:NAD(P)-dependent dehydrogenase (short-subunit alcohol dehydrogenase family)
MKVVIGDLLQAHLDEARGALGTSNRLHCIRLDVSDRAAMNAAARETAEVFGNVHVLCNNVGVSQRNPIDEASHADWDYVLNVNTSSMAGMIPVPSFAGIYATSKFAVRGMSDALRLALAPYGIGVSVLCPGLVRTRAMTAGDLYRTEHEHRDAPDELRQAVDGGMDPAQVGELVAQAIEANRPYIFPHGEFVPEVRAYFDEMLAAFPAEFEMDERRRTGEERRAKMTAEAKALADSLE